MDDNTKDVLVTAIQVGGGLVIGLLVAAIGFWSTRKLERERWSREDALREQERDRERHGRWLDRRRDVYANFLGAAMESRLSAEYPAESAVRFYQAGAEAELMRPDMGEAIHELIGTARDFDVSIEDYASAIAAFRTKAIADLES